MAQDRNSDSRLADVGESQQGRDDEKRTIVAELQRAYLLHCIEARHTDATKLARLAKLEPSTITTFLGPKPRVKELRRTTMEAVERATMIPLPKGLSVGAAPSAVVSAEAMAVDVPVHSLISSPVEHAYYWNPTAIDFVARPHGITYATRVFALRMPDASMAGWRRVNELVYVDPLRPVAAGDHVFAELGNVSEPNGHSIYVIRRLMVDTPKRIELATWNDAYPKLEMARVRVLSLSRVLEWQELISG